MLNTLANHGFIARNGKDISIDQLVNAIEEAINISPNSTRPVVEFGATTSTTGNPNTFHLSDLNQHGGEFRLTLLLPPSLILFCPFSSSANRPSPVIEHDGSLSRNDLYFGDNHSFNSSIYNTVAKFFTKSTISIETAARARKARLAAAAAANPQFQYGEQEETVSLFETALYLATFGTGTQGNAPTKYVNILFRKF